MRRSAFLEASGRNSLLTRVISVLYVFIDVCAFDTYNKNYLLTYLLTAANGNLQMLPTRTLYCRHTHFIYFILIFIMTSYTYYSTKNKKKNKKRAM